MTPLPLKTLSFATVLFGAGIASADAALVMVPAAPDRHPLVQTVAMGDLPTVPRRRGGGRRANKGKDKPYQPLAKDPAGESANAHKEYLKRYGF